MPTYSGKLSRMLSTISCLSIGLVELKRTLLMLARPPHSSHYEVASAGLLMSWLFEELCFIKRLQLEKKLKRCLSGRACTCRIELPS